MTLNEVLKNTNYDVSLFSEEARKYVEDALFHEIIDPLDEEWQVIFKNAYLVLKEIVDLNIATIETR